MNITRFVLGVLATILLGAIGSGLWDVILKPTLPWLLNISLNIVTFGVQATKDEIYMEIARGAPSASIKMILMFSSAFTAAICVDNTLRYSKRYFGKIKEQRNNTGDGGIMCDSTSKTGWKLTLFIAMFSIFSFVFLLLITARAVYIDDASANMRNAITITAPFLTDKKRLEYLSRIAQMKSRADFEKIYVELQELSKQNGSTIPNLYLF
jgi:hypothetical protein